MPSPADLLVLYGGRPGEGLVFAPDRSGWAVYRTGAAEPDVWIAVRLGRVHPDVRFVVVALRVEAPGRRDGIQARDVRTMPIGRIEALANAPEWYRRLNEFIDDDLEGVLVDLPLADVDGWDWTFYEPARPRSPRLKMKVPTTLRKPDSFYEQVAERFAYLTGVSERPATELAEANGVPVTTVHGWVREARKRGFLVPGERSRKS